MFQGKMLETYLKMNDTHPTKFSGTRKSTNTPDSPGGVFDSCACLPNYVLGWFPEARRKMVSKWLRSHDHILYRGNNCNYIFDSYIMYIYNISMYSMSCFAKRDRQGPRSCKYIRADHGPWPKQHWQLPLHQLLLGLLPRLLPRAKCINDITSSACIS